MLQNKYVSTKSRNPIVQQASIEVADWEEIRGTAMKQIHVNKINKSNCLSSLQKGGQIGGGGLESSSEKKCEENFFETGTGRFSTHFWIQIYPSLGV